MSEVMKHQRHGYFPVKEIIYNMYIKTVMLLLALHVFFLCYKILVLTSTNLKLLRSHKLCTRTHSPHKEIPLVSCLCKFKTVYKFETECTWARFIGP